MANKSFNPVKKFVSAEYSKTNGDSGSAGDVTPKRHLLYQEEQLLQML